MNRRLFAMVSCTLSATVAGYECRPDLDCDGRVDGTDLARLLGNWNTADPIADINVSGNVDAMDLAQVLGRWGLCQGW